MTNYIMYADALYITKAINLHVRIQVNEKFHKLERVYRDSIKKDKRQDQDNTHCKNVRVILTLSGLAQLHLFRGFYSVKM